MRTVSVEYPTDWEDYQLIDSGGGMKLEQFAGYVIARPDPRALWHKLVPDTVWNSAHASYVRTSPSEGHWNIKTNPPALWQIQYDACTLRLRPTEFKHVGVFPEQAVNWRWLTHTIGEKPLQVLNLFAYTGAATVTSALAGAHVTHVDSLKSVISWAKENADLSHVSSDRIRWIEDDAYKFVIREGRRNKKYDGIILDPPRFGRGTKGEVWKLEEDLPKLLAACKDILSARPTFFLINAYTADLSSLVLNHMVQDLVKPLGGTITSGELAQK